jgi:hypothetical protein
MLPGDQPGPYHGPPIGADWKRGRGTGHRGWRRGYGPPGDPERSLGRSGWWNGTGALNRDRRCVEGPPWCAFGAGRQFRAPRLDEAEIGPRRLIISDRRRYTVDLFPVNHLQENRSLSATYWNGGEEARHRSNSFRRIPSRTPLVQRVKLVRPVVSRCTSSHHIALCLAGRIMGSGCHASRRSCQRSR